MKKSLFITLIMLGFVAGKAMAQNYQVHTLYMYSFTKYVKWPDSYSEGDFIIGIVGKSPIKEHLLKMASLKKVGTRLIRVVEFDSVDEIDKCNMLFIPGGQSDNFEEIKSRLSGSPTLLLTEKEGLGKKGSGINFIIRQNKLLFELNQSEVEASGLQISQELVKFAIMI